MLRLWLVGLVACSKATTTEEHVGVTPKPRPEVKVELAGVTLGDDCADGVRTKPTPPPPAGGASARPSGATAPGAALGDCGGPNCNMPPPACEQTVMQLAVHAPADADATKVKITRVELLDEAGQPFGKLTPRTPTKWDGSAYVPWDEAVPAGKAELVVSYKLSSPDWSKTNGRLGAAGKKFTLRVTAAVSDRERTLEMQTIVIVMPEPNVVT